MAFPFQLSERLYNQLKWFVTIVLPAFGTFYVTLGQTFADLPNPEGVAAAVLAITTFLGALLGISTHNYNKNHVATGTIVVTEHENGYHQALQLEKTPEELAQLERVTFNVTRENPDGA